MAVKHRFECRDCGRESLRWEGRCPGCGAWNSVDEITAGPGRAGGSSEPPGSLAAFPESATGRLLFDLGDLDRVLGGGLVPGSIALLGGPPGIGKSTLLLQIAARAGRDGRAPLYVSGEESGDQVRSRATRLGGRAEEVLFLGATSLERILEAAASVHPSLLCVDSIQTTVASGSSSAPGTVSQVRECAAALQAFAKRSGTPTVLVGHVTKGGLIAGPRTLEHLVDVVLHFEGPRAEGHRILRATKNRFGRVGEFAMFRMGMSGLYPIIDPGAVLLADRVAGVPGSAITVTLEGARAVPVEVQALTAGSTVPGPKRMTTGFSVRRLAMLLAVLGRRAGIALDRSEVFVNVVGGLRVSDPAADAAVAAAIISAELDLALPPDVAFLGEVGLSGELRGLAHREPRLRELARIGVRQAVAPPRTASADEAAEAAEDGTGGGGARSPAGSGRDEPASAEQRPAIHSIATIGGLAEWIASMGEIRQVEPRAAKASSEHPGVVR